MRDQGLLQAIHATDGGSTPAPVAEAARTSFTRISFIGAAAIDETDAARAREYALLAALLMRAPDAELLRQLSRLSGDASPLGMAHLALAEAAGRSTAEKVSREYFDLFIGIGRGELLPYGSYYLAGFLHERPLARLRGDLAWLGIERTDHNPEPEDHAATLCEVMAGLIRGEFAAEPGAEREFFGKHIEPWFERLFDDLVRAERAVFYRAVGVLGRVFIGIERDALALPG